MELREWVWAESALPCTATDSRRQVIMVSWSNAELIPSERGRGISSEDGETISAGPGEDTYR